MKRAWLIRVLSLCCAVLLWMTGCEGDETTTRTYQPMLTGTVTYYDGSPAAHVWIGAAISEYRVRDAKTDSEGRYVFPSDSGSVLQLTVNLENPRRQYSYTVPNQEDVFDIRLPVNE